MSESKAKKKKEDRQQDMMNEKVIGEGGGDGAPVRTRLTPEAPL